MMRRIGGFLSDPGLHLLAIALVLIVLAIGSTGPQEPRESQTLVYCEKCRTSHHPEWTGSFTNHDRIAQSRP
jgi:hypothetical protein